jgi:hypothetical protein
MIDTTTINHLLRTVPRGLVVQRGLEEFWVLMVVRKKKNTYSDLTNDLF